MNGSLVKSEKNNNIELTMDVAELQNGMYIIQAIDESNIYTEKLIKQ